LLFVVRCLVFVVRCLLFVTSTGSVHRSASVCCLSLRQAHFDRLSASQCKCLVFVFLRRVLLLSFIGNLTAKTRFYRQFNGKLHDYWKTYFVAFLSPRLKSIFFSTNSIKSYLAVREATPNLF